MLRKCLEIRKVRKKKRKMRNSKKDIFKELTTRLNRSFLLSFGD
jgi:hypothetical protein